MADRTRTKDVCQLEDSIKRLKKKSNQQSTKLKELVHMMIVMNLKIDQLAEKSLALRVSMEVSGLIPTQPRTGSTSSMNHTQTKFLN